jgi:hypothetical protein
MSVGSCSTTTAAAGGSCVASAAVGVPFCCIKYDISNTMCVSLTAKTGMIAIT